MKLKLLDNRVCIVYYTSEVIYEMKLVRKKQSRIGKEASPHGPTPMSKKLSRICIGRSIPSSRTSLHQNILLKKISALLSFIYTIHRSCSYFFVFYLSIGYLESWHSLVTDFTSTKYSFEKDLCSSLIHLYSVP